MSRSKKRFKQCRRLGLNVIGHPKAMKRSTNHTSRETRNLSNYGKQLLEKQRLRAYYNIREKVIRKYIQKINAVDGPMNEQLILRLERRLDNIIYRLGFANSIRQARQMVVHGHILVNTTKVTSPSYEVSINETIQLREKSRRNPLFKENFQKNSKSKFAYLEKNTEDFSGSLIRLPERKEIPIQIQDHLVVEFYSKVR